MAQGIPFPGQRSHQVCNLQSGQAPRLATTAMPFLAREGAVVFSGCLLSDKV